MSTSEIYLHKVYLRNSFSVNTNKCTRVVINLTEFSGPIKKDTKTVRAVKIVICRPLVALVENNTFCFSIIFVKIVIIVVVVFISHIIKIP